MLRLNQLRPSELCDSIATDMRAALLLLLPAAVLCVDDGQARTPPQGHNTWMAIGWDVTDAYIRETALFMNTSGLQAAGYTYINSDDGWSSHRINGTIIPDPKRWPNGLNVVTSYVHSLGLKFGLYSSASSVVCSGRPGSLFYERVDAASLAAWEVDFLKLDNCGSFFCSGFCSPSLLSLSTFSRRCRSVRLRQLPLPGLW